MRNTLIIIVFIAILSVGCTHHAVSEDEALITSERIKQDLAKHNIALSEPQGLSSDNVFTRVLNGVQPVVYSIRQDQWISFYVYSSSREAQKGLQEFENIPASFVKHSRYQVENVLLFYIGGDVETENRIQAMMDGWP